MKRRLAAILSADVAGYSRLMGADEEDTLRRLTEWRKVFFDYIQRHGGRVVNAPGDALWPSSAAWCTRSRPPSRSSASWPSATAGCPKSAACGSASASTSGM